MTVKNTLIPLLMIGAAVLILSVLMLQLDGTGFADSMRMGEGDHHDHHTYGGQWVGSLLKIVVIGGVAGGITLGVRRLFGRARK